MFCTSCGKQLPENAKVCPFCGVKLDYIPQEESAPINSAPVMQENTAAVTPAVSLEKSAASVSTLPQEAPVQQPNPIPQEPPVQQPTPIPQETPVQQPTPIPQEVPVQQPNPIPQQAPVQQTYPAQQPNPAPASNGSDFIKKNKNALIYGGVGLSALLVIIIAICIFVGFSKRVDLTKYIEVSAEGYNGYGRVTYSLDNEKLLNDVYKVDYISELSSPKDVQAWNQLCNVTFDVDGNIKNVSNGDKVTIKIKNLETIMKKSGVHLKKNDTIEFTVEGLEEPSSFSAEDIFEASFEGFNGGGCVLLTVNDDKLPFNIKAVWGDTVNIDDTYSLKVKTSGNEGKLSNGDEFKVSLKDDNSVSKYLLNEYGMYIDSDTEAVFKVSGLGEADKLDIFSYVDIKAQGVDGNASLNYHWNDTEINVGNLVITVEDENYNYFRISGKVQTPDRAYMIINSDDYDTTDEPKYIGSFAVEADKTYSISGGDTITIKVTNGYNEVNSDDYASYGLTFSNTSKEMNINGADLDRYITSAKKLNKENILAFTDSVSKNVEQQILDNWAYYVYNTSRFTCYDQEVTSCKPAGAAYFVCNSKRSNTYTLCVPFQCKVKDSELDGEKTVFILMKVNSPLITGSTEEIKADRNSLSFDYIEKISDVSDKLDRIADGDDSIVEIKLK